MELGTQRLSWTALTADILRMLSPRHKRQLIGVLLVSMAAACFTVIGVASIAPFFAVLADPDIVRDNEIMAWLRQSLQFTSDRQFFAALGFGFVVLVCIANLVNFLSLLAIGRFSQNVGASLHVELFEEFIHRDLAFHKETNSKFLETQVVQEVNRAVDGVVRSALLVLAGSLSVVLITGAVFYFDPAVAVGVFGLLALAYFIVYRLVRRRLSRNGQITTRFWRLRSKTIAESFDAVRELTLLDAQGMAVADVAVASRGVARASASTAAVAVCPKFLLECFVVVVLVLAALQVYGRADSDVWLTQLAFLSFAAYRLLPALQQVFSGSARIRAEYDVFSEIVAILSQSRLRSSDAAAARADPDWLGRPLEAIELVGVTYRHSTSRLGGVEEVTMRIPAGRVVGLVGPSGSGKTTLAELILGLMPPDAGHILIDGRLLDRDTRRSWFATVAYVPQRIVLTHGTIADNIAFGVPPEALDPDKLTEVVDAAQLRTLVESLPLGLETDIGEDGAQLSGGERQRIGIARALYRRASLLVLDEATSALDAESEAQILRLIAELRGRCTTIVISHHARVVSCCELLYRFDGGRLVTAEEPQRPFVAHAKSVANQRANS